MQTQELYKWGRIALIALTVFLAVSALGGLKSLRTIDPAYNSITVTGEGEAFAIPDVASFSFTVSADAKTVAAAQEEVTKKMDAILAKVKDLGIEDKDVKTTDYSVWPKYTYSQGVCTMQYPSNCSPGRQVQDGYTASHSVTVKVRDTEKAGEALSAAGSLGATNLSSLNFTVDDPDAVMNEARALAIEDAKEKAEILSKELGVRLVRVVSYSDGGNSPMPYYSREAFGMGGDTAVAQSKAPTLPVGENKAQVSVSVTYEIR